MLKLNSIEAHLVRNQFEYDKYLSEAFKEANAFEDLEYLPLIVIKPERQEFGALPLLCDVSFEPVPESDITFEDTDYIIVNADGTSLSVDFGNAPEVILSISNNLMYTDERAIKVVASSGDSEKVLSAEVRMFTKDELLQLAEEALLQQGESSGFIVGELIVAMQEADKKLAEAFVALEGFGEYARTSGLAITALEGSVAAFEGRVAALEGGAAALEGRVAALEGAAAPEGV